MGRKILDFIDAELKNQVIGLQLATEIKLYPETSVITRYCHIELVNDNKAWIPRFIEQHGLTLGLILTSPFPTSVIDFNLFGIKLSHCISTPWMYGSRGAQCKAGVSYVLFLNSLNLFAGKDVVLEKRFKNRQWGQNRCVLKPQTFEIAKLKFGC